MATLEVREENLQKKWCSADYIANKGSKRVGRVIESFLNRKAESKLGFSWWLYQTLEIPIIYLVLKRRNSCITLVRNIRVGLWLSINVSICDLLKKNIIFIQILLEIWWIAAER